MTSNSSIRSWATVEMHKEVGDFVIFLNGQIKKNDSPVE